jgi:hypothetical protein
MSLLALQDLFRRYREKATGIWTLGKEPGRTIFIDYGDTVFAQSTHLQDRLTYLLVERGKVTQAQMDYALANLKPGLSIGKNLIEMGFITQRDLLDVAKAQVERIIRGALACADLAPSFTAQELDANVVRLPMNTPQLFLTGTLALQDREGLLEMLGPLNQVVVLQGRSLMDLTLPPDLAKLPPLLDGTHTLLELSRESLAEPLRLGAFALFLREMGWARLHEMPPLDRHALDLALEPDPEPLSPLLADFPETVPSLFSTIQEAARPTTNLEHLSQALDEEPGPVEVPEAALVTEPLYLPEAVGWPAPPPEPAAPAAEEQADLSVDAGQGYPPTPAMPIQAMPEEPEDPPVPMVPLEAGAAPEGPAPGPAGPAPAAGKGLRRTLLALFVLACLGGAGYLWLNRAKARAWFPRAAAPAAMGKAPAPPPPPEPAPPIPAPAQPAASIVVPPPPEPAPPARPALPAPAAVTELSISIPARLKALEQGDLDLAVRQGQRLAREIPPGHWTLRLEIACQGDTIRRLVDIFKGKQPDIFLLPISLVDGRVCYQVLYGRFPSQAAAEKQLKRLPPSFLADRNRPKTFRFSEIPKVQ